MQPCQFQKLYFTHEANKTTTTTTIERIHRSPAGIVKGNISEWKTVRQTLSKFGPSLTSILRPFQDNVKVHF